MTPLKAATHNLFVKMEAFNAGGSHKSRAARHIVQDMLDNGDTKGKRILEKSGGNFGIGLALAAAKHGISVDLVIAPHFSPIKRALCEQYGARIVGDEMFQEGVMSRDVVDALMAENPGLYHFTDQFANAANIRAHLTETGPELAEQLKMTGIGSNQPLFFVGTAGTGASFGGISKVLAGHFDNLTGVMVEPEGSDFLNDVWVCHALDGAHVGEFPPFLDRSLIHERRWVTNEQAFDGQGLMARDIGFFPGVTSGSTYKVARELADARPDAIVVSIAYDHGEASLMQRAA
jgi:cysteine synthase